MSRKLCKFELTECNGKFTITDILNFSIENLNKLLEETNNIIIVNNDTFNLNDVIFNEYFNFEGVININYQDCWLSEILNHCDEHTEEEIKAMIKLIDFNDIHSYQDRNSTNNCFGLKYIKNNKWLKNIVNKRLLIKASHVNDDFNIDNFDNLCNRNFLLDEYQFELLFEKYKKYMIDEIGDNYFSDNELKLALIDYIYHIIN